jgi:hypothetical protein
MGHASCVCFRMFLDQLHCGQEYLCAGARGHEGFTCREIVGRFFLV